MRGARSSVLKLGDSNFETFEFLTSRLTMRCIEKYRFNHLTRGGSVRGDIVSLEEKREKKGEKRRFAVKKDATLNSRQSAPGHFFRGFLE